MSDVQPHQKLISVLLGWSKKKAQWKAKVINGEGNLLTSEKVIEEAARAALEEFSEHIEDLDDDQIIDVCKGLFVRSIAMLAVTSEEDPERGEIINELTKDITSRVFKKKVRVVPHLHLVK